MKTITKKSLLLLRNQGGQWGHGSLKYFRFRGPTGIRGPRKVGPNKGPMHTRGHYRKGPHQIKDPYTDNDPYRQRAPNTYGVQFLQIQDPYMIYMQVCEGLLQTRAPASEVLYMIYRQRAPYRYGGSP